jgi:DNA invertase Pin-like site-specific DNA recombinase
MSGNRTMQSDEQTSNCPLRCAIYTRKSTEEGLNREFNTLEAQREAAEAYVASQWQLGWVLLAERYDDGGNTGANLERPALRRLLEDIERGTVGCVLVYKIDRLSRSLLDFARLIEVFERHHVSLVSVTQPLNTTASLGRPTLNILLSFAQFEREMISDRTRDKMAAARRKGKWVGGTPVLGYDIAATGSRLLVNPEEAERVRAIFELYLQHGALETVLAELQQRRWTTKSWRARDGIEHAGQPFAKAGLERLLRNVLYVGRVVHQGESYAGEQKAIVELVVWERVQQRLGSQPTRSKSKKLRVRRKSSDALHATERVPRITRLLALALRFEELIRSGAVSNYTVLAQLGRVSRSRITQLTGVLNLAPDIQEEILFLRHEESRQLRISEPAVRKLSATLMWDKQREQWRRLRPQMSAL